jgi:hypothetical protein
MAVENIGRWRVGDVEVFSIPEVVSFNDDINVLLPNATPELVLKYPFKGLSSRQAAATSSLIPASARIDNANMMCSVI